MWVAGSDLPAAWKACATLCFCGFAAWLRRTEMISGVLTIKRLRVAGVVLEESIARSEHKLVLELHQAVGALGRAQIGEKAERIVHGAAFVGVAHAKVGIPFRDDVDQPWVIDLCAETSKDGGRVVSHFWAGLALRLAEPGVDRAQQAAIVHAISHFPVGDVRAPGALGHFDCSLHRWGRERREDAVQRIGVAGDDAREAAS
eukprot:6266117-Prymnesium_polylepis.2